MRGSVLSLLTCGAAAFLAAQSAPSEISLVRVASELASPVDIQSAGDGSKRLFVLQQNGIIRVMRNGTLNPSPFLAITSKTRSNGECGLLGMAFPPGFATKQYFYVNYTDPNCRNSIVARYRITSDRDVADANSEEIVLQQAQPFSNHNGGGLAFGPDGFLYIGLGDGGSGGDPQNNGQNAGTWLGKMLRIDTESSERPYRVPPGNPFVGDARFKPEIWAYGLRNPWRYSFDRQTGDLWIADVGQNRAEEVNFQSAASRGGENYGWRIMEGFSCYNASTCNQDNLVKPVHEYTRNNGDISITGGYVYRGARWSSLRGTYIYGDYASGRIWGIRRDGPLFNNRLLLQGQNVSISTFGQDEDGEIYVGDHNGNVFRIEGRSGPLLTSRSVLNAASFQPGITPGSLATAFASGITNSVEIVSAQSVPLPRELAGVRLLINGSPAPILAVANVNGQEQVNFQAPFEISGANSVRVAVSYQGATSPEIEVPVTAQHPGIFVSDGLGLVVHQRGFALMTAENPLDRGESVFFYATGLGPVSNTPETGAGGPTTSLAIARTTPSVSFGGETVQAAFSGLAPGFVGIYQVNVSVPANARSGAQDMTISVAGSTSPPVRIVVR